MYKVPLDALKKIIFTASLCFVLCHSAESQTLAAGDIAFTGYNSTGTNVDSFSFVLLVSIPAGTSISFTDNGWLANNSFFTSEQHLTWTSSQPIAAGREITIYGNTSPTPLTPVAIFSKNGSSAGTCTGVMTSLATSGDQVIAYQGNIASPTIISAIHMNVYAVTGSLDCGNTDATNWDPLCIDGGTGTIGNSNFSRKPPTLTTGTNAIWIGTMNVTASEEDWGVFDPTINNPPLSTPAQVRAAVNDQNNWRHGDGIPNRRTNPSGASFLGLAPLPVKLISFTGAVNPDRTITLHWRVAEQQDIRQYIVETSVDGVIFKTLSVVSPEKQTAVTYTYTDKRVSAGITYYRLGIEESSGKVINSRILAVSRQWQTQINISPNPAKDLLIVQQSGGGKKTATILNALGIQVRRFQLQGPQETVNIATLPPGLYILKPEEGSAVKFIKE